MIVASKIMNPFKLEKSRQDQNSPYLPVFSVAGQAHTHTLHPGVAKVEDAADSRLPVPANFQKCFNKELFLFIL
jgi:hypothetical protein